MLLCSHCDLANQRLVCERCAHELQDLVMVVVQDVLAAIAVLKVPRAACCMLCAVCC